MLSNVCRSHSVGKKQDSAARSIPKNGEGRGRAGQHRRGQHTQRELVLRTRVVCLFVCLFVCLVVRLFSFFVVGYYQTNKQTNKHTSTEEKIHYNTNAFLNRSQRRLSEAVLLAAATYQRQKQV